MTNKIKDAERVLKALANARRLAIVMYLQKNSGAKVGSIAEAIDLSFKSTSKHLSVLSNVNIIASKQVSLEMHYGLQSPMHPLVRTALSIL